jgi:hypothetical protein
VLWNAVPGDFKDPDGWPEVALRECRSRPWTLLVLHDLPNGAMRHLGSFLSALRASGAALRQDFPPDCVPLRRGEVIQQLGLYVKP